MIDQGLLGSSQKTVNKIKLKLNCETTSEDTNTSNDDVEQVSSPKQNIAINTQSDIHH